MMEQRARQWTNALEVTDKSFGVMGLRRMRRSDDRRERSPSAENGNRSDRFG
jgi:hypothetical protein